MPLRSSPVPTNRRVLCGSVGAAFVTGVCSIALYIMKRHDAKDDKKSAEHKALCYVMLYIIEERAKDVLADGEVELDELRRLHHWHKVYKQLGGNGDANSLMKRLEALPIVNE